MKHILAILLLVISANAVNKTVKAGGGGDFTTIQACATAMSAGDSCTVFAGTYAEHVTVLAGGVGSYRTLIVNPGDTVSVLDFTLNSHDKLNGFTITNPSSPNSTPCVSITGGATDYFVTNNTMSSCSSFLKESNNANTTHGFIQGNTMSYSCSTPGAPNVCRAVTINGDYHLIENNDVSHVSDGFYVFGAHNVVRNNTFHDVNISECGSIDPGCHIDFLQADAVTPATQPAQYLLVEGNTVKNMVGANTHAFGILQAESCGGNCFNAIIRFHKASHVGSGGIADDNSFVTPPPQAWINVKAYNNSWIDVNNLGNGNGEQTNGFSHGSFGGSEINDLLYYPFSLTDFNPYSCTDTACSPFTFKNNLAFCTGGTCNIHSHIYGSGAFTDDPGNIKVNPLFVNYAGNDFHLQTGSPARNAGSFLTTATGSGSSSTALIVADSGFFQDGAGITGVQADWIRIGASTTVQIASVVDATHITLASPVSWSGGTPIYLYRKSDGVLVLNTANPDIGALPFPIAVPIVQLSCPSQPCSGLTFGPQALGTQSDPQTVTLTNTGTAALSITSLLVVTNQSSGHFLDLSSGGGNQCGSTLAIAASCQIIVAFAPVTAGTTTGVISIADNASGSPQNVPLIGTGVVNSTFQGTSLIQGNNIIQ